MWHGMTFFFFLLFFFAYLHACRWKAHMRIKVNFHVLEVFNWKIRITFIILVQCQPEIIKSGSIYKYFYRTWPGNPKMKEGVASIVVVCLTLIFTNAQTVPFKELYIDQYVDHFNFVSYGETIFKERYLLQGL